jgi:hypothetical protein
VICSGGTQNRKRHSLITRPRHLRASAIAISRENPHSQACDYSPHYGQWPLSSTVMLRDCQTGGENDRLGAGACRGSRRRLRHSISAVGPKIPSTEALKIARAGLFTSRQTSSHRISVQAIFFRRRPPAEKATAREDQSGKASTGDWARYSGRVQPHVVETLLSSVPKRPLARLALPSRCPCPAAATA